MLSFQTSQILTKINILLFALNLCPALPLDGGRLGVALTCNCLGIQRATRLFSCIGIIFGVLLALAGVGLYFFAGYLNVTVIICGAYIFCGSLKSFKASPLSLLQAYSSRQSTLHLKKVMPVANLAVASNVAACQILKKMSPGYYYKLTFFDENHNRKYEKWEDEFIDEVLNNSI